MCGSGLKAVLPAAPGIATSDLEVAVAGGMESISHAPYLPSGSREGSHEGLRIGDNQILDSMITDRLWCSFEQCHMGMAGEIVATDYSVGRRQQDEYAFRSHRKAAKA